MEDDQNALERMAKMKSEDGDASDAHPDVEQGASTLTPNARDEQNHSPADASLEDVKSRSESAEAFVSTKPPRLSRKASQKSMGREALLFDHLPDVTGDSCKLFQVIPDCLYGSKHLGASDNDALDCECREDWNDGQNFACGDDSCINRATKMECSADADNCGGGCQNQRFQRKQYARVSVIKTEKKGFGLRADSDLQANDFVYEYIGEVINEPTFRRRMIQYDEDGIKHFYFMSLHKGEFVDATKKGNLGRFCNHSCNPNCYVDKWVVGDKFRMGIFTLRPIRAGEELVFNYNVDRYGADPQPCYCGEPNCVGFIGGKTQTERSTKLPTAIIEALGIDYADGWDTSVAKKPRKKRPDEDDEEYVASVQARGLDEEDARKVMAALVQCKEKWIAVKLLERIQQCDDERVVHCVMRMHAYQILKTTLNTFIGDHNVVLQVLSILDKFPRLTRNKIQDSHIDTTVEGLVNSEHDDVASRSKKLLDEWSKLEVAYRIRRRKADPVAPTAPTVPEDKKAAQVREEERSQSSPRTASPRQIDAPKGPRNTAPQRNNAYFHNGPRQRRPPFNAPLPQGWFATKDARGNTYFYDKQGTTTWKRPMQPAAEPTQKAPSKAIQEQLLIQSIIAKVTKEGTPKQPASQNPQNVESPAKDTKKEKWRALPVEKQMKLYENTVFPPVKYVLDKFRHKLPKDELKRLGKEIAKKLVASDYKNNRVNDPTAELSEKQVHKIKKYVRDFLDRAVQKYQEHQKRKDSKDGDAPHNDGHGRNNAASTIEPASGTPTDSPTRNGEIAMADDGDNVSLSDAGQEESPSTLDLKRKREGEPTEMDVVTPSDGPEAKRLKEDLDEATPPPPPPPPPMDSPMDDAVTAEQQALREQEEALERENEEAQRLEDEANKTKRLEDAAVGIEIDVANAKDQLISMGESEAGTLHLQRTDGTSSSLSRDEANGTSEVNEQNRARTQEVLGH